MAILVGSVDCTTYHTIATAGTMYVSRYVAAASGTGSTIFAWCTVADGTPNGKLAVYDSAGTRIALSAGQALESGLVSAAISCSITASSVYFLGVIIDGGEINVDENGGAWDTATVATGSYASPPATLTPYSEGNGNYYPGLQAIYVTSAEATGLGGSLTDGGLLVGIVDGGLAR